MILFDLSCAANHAFEAWFPNGEACESQIAGSEVACPVCGDTSVRKLPAAPALLRGGGVATQAAQLRETLAALRRHVEANCDYVGERFPEEARRIHYGETEERAIYGEASPDEAKALADEGIQVAAIPWPARQDS